MRLAGGWGKSGWGFHGNGWVGRVHGAENERDGGGFSEQGLNIHHVQVGDDFPINNHYLIPRMYTWPM